MEMRYGISPLGQMPSSCTMQPWAPVHQHPNELHQDARNPYMLSSRSLLIEQGAEGGPGLLLPGLSLFADELQQQLAGQHHAADGAGALSG